MCTCQLVHGVLAVFLRCLRRDARDVFEPYSFLHTYVDSLLLLLLKSGFGGYIGPQFTAALACMPKISSNYL